MKKSLLALAVLGTFAGTASAQSSVTLYGRMDLNITNSKPGTGDDVWRMDNGSDLNGISGSHWGLRGSEDLGRGLRAYFDLESGFRGDTGAGASRLFDRRAYVALGSKTLGDMRFGRQWTVTREFNSKIADVSALGAIKIDEVISAGGASRPLYQTFGQRADNSITYLTPNFGGFQVMGQVSLGENVTARNQGALATYKVGPLALGLAFEEYHGFGETYNKVLSAGANYNFGVAHVFGAFQHTSDLGSATAAPTGAAGSIDKYNVWNIGVLVPFGALSLRAQYIRASYDFNGASDQDVSKYGISARYLLSKQTMLYSAISQRSGDNKDSFKVKREITLLGLAHNF